MYGTPAYHPTQVRAAETAVMPGLPDGALMQRAATAVAVQALAMLGFSYGARVLVLAGPGDNGGDALFAGAMLARRGVAVRAVLAVPDRVHAAALTALRSAGGRVIGLDAVGSTDLIIDGLVGIGASGPLRESLVPAARLAVRSAAPVLAVDLPSGVDPVTGAVTGEAVMATVTVCLGAIKTGLLVGPGRLHAGRVQLVDIGISHALAEPALYQLTDGDLAALLPTPSPSDDKYTRGVVGVVAGSEQYPGAAQLAVGAALLGGVGAVRYAGHAAREVSRRHPEVLVTATVTGAGRVQAWAVGPGLGDTPEAVQALRQVLTADVPVLVDADGLNLLADDRSPLAARTAPTVLTPHDREFERLFGPVGDDRVAAARRAADGSGTVVLLKGYATVIAAPHGCCYVNPTGSSALATAGSGDVLSGLIGSLLAAGLAPLTAAAAGAYLHGQAGAAAGPGPVSAPDLVAVLPAVIAALRRAA